MWNRLVVLTELKKDWKKFLNLCGLSVNRFLTNQVMSVIKPCADEKGLYFLHLRNIPL